MKWILASLFLIGTAAHAAKPTRFQMTASESRQDGIMISLSPPYPYLGEIFFTMTRELCYAVGTPMPFDDNRGLVSLMKINGPWGGGDSFSKETPMVFDNLAPEDVHLCYLVVGRGQVEAAGWGFRMPANGPGGPVKSNGMTASSDRTDGILIKQAPALKDFSELYATPDRETCPRTGDRFTPAGRFVKVGKTFFNGKYFFDKDAAIAIDLCYYLISIRTGLVVDSAWGYRQP